MIDVPDLNQYLPDDGDTPEEGLGGQPTPGASRTETASRDPVLAPRPVKKPETKSAPDQDGRVPVPARSRAFPLDPDASVYALVLEPIRRPSVPVMLSVAAVGDDTDTTPVRFTAARRGSRPVAVPRAGQIGPVPQPASGPLRLEVTLADPQRLALHVTAYEAPAHETE